MDRYTEVHINSSRNYGIDALRSVSMLMVVMSHVLVMGGILYSSNPINHLIAYFLEISSFCAINCYALISGYVGIYSKYKISNLAFLWCRVAFYTVSINILFKCIAPESIDNQTLISSFFPVFSNQYWYFTAYALMFLFIPILNEGICRLSENSIRIIIYAVIAMSVIYPFVTDKWGDIFNLNEGYSTLWLAILYVIGGYIRKYGFLKKLKSHRTAIFLLLYLAFVLITFVSLKVIPIVSEQIFGYIKYDKILLQYNSITMLSAAVCLLLAFEQIEFSSFWIKIIAFFSPLTFGVYTIHEQKQVRARLIINSFVWVAELPAYLMLPLVIGIVIGIFLICSIIDLVRHNLFKAFKLKKRLELLELKILKSSANNEI